ncbi:Nuf2 family-domain-containing protein [Lentinula aff. detonsa]|uniref:Nuf2 family-domain-containing protein n=1 Tax=Lentinula aff. detonsa TaxID=2804958 RepID=A0AA38KUG3_9AGAR|nr:Nuf2 family-domain-containing protein [Lentinula aff. detonsa]
MGAKGTYSLMSIPDIVDSLGVWGLTVEEDRLMRPTPEFVEFVFCACLAQVTGINREDLIEPAQEALTISSIEEKDNIYLSALTHNLLCYHLTRFANAARVDDFSAYDISRPTKDRTLLLLSAFINFVKFTEQLCNPFVNELASRSDALLVERDQISGKLAQVQKRIQELKAKRDKDEPLCQELRAKNKQLGDFVLQTKVAQQAVMQEVDLLKEEKTRLMERKPHLYSFKEYIQRELEAASDTNKRIKGRIVQSPERVKRSISTMSVSRVEYKKTVGINEAKTRDLQAKINALVIIEQDLRTCIDQLQVVEKEMKSLQDIQKDLAELKDQLDDKKIERNELRLKQERVAKQLENAHAKLTLTQQRAADKKAANARIIERLQAEYNDMDEERKENDLQLAEIRKEAGEVEEKTSEHLKASEEELNSLLKEYWSLKAATSEYRKAYNTALTQAIFCSPLVDVYMETLATKLNMKMS